MQLAVVHDNFIYPISFSDGIVMVVQGESGGGEIGVNPMENQFSWYDSSIQNIHTQYIAAYQESDYEPPITNWQQLEGYVYITPFNSNGEYTFPYILYTVNNNVTNQLVGLSSSQFYNLNTTESLDRPSYQSATFTINNNVNESKASISGSLSCVANKLYLAIISIFCQINRSNNYDVRSIPYLDIDITNANYQSNGQTACVNYTSSVVTIVKAFSLSDTGVPAIKVSKVVNNDFVPSGNTIAGSDNTVMHVNNLNNASGKNTYNQNTIRILEVNQIHYNT